MALCGKGEKEGFNKKAQGLGSESECSLEICKIEKSVIVQGQRLRSCVRCQDGN